MIRAMHPHSCLLQVRCLSIDSLGQLLLTGDESGSICVRLLHPRDANDSSTSSTPSRVRVAKNTANRRKELGAGAVAEGVRVGVGIGAGSGGGGGGGVAKVLEGAHAGDVLAISHVEGSLSMSPSEGLSEEQTGAGGGRSSLFVSGGKGEEQGRKKGQAGYITMERENGRACVHFVLFGVYLYSSDNIRHQWCRRYPRSTEHALYLMANVLAMASRSLVSTGRPWPIVPIMSSGRRNQCIDMM